MLFVLTVNRCCVCGSSGGVLWRLIRAPDKAVAVATADSAAAASAAPVALVVRLRPIGGKHQAAALAGRVTAAAKVSPAAEGSCCRCSALGGEGEVLGPVSRGS